jgi:hypothetical protein
MGEGDFIAYSVGNTEFDKSLMMMKKFRSFIAFMNRNSPA